MNNAGKVVSEVVSETSRVSSSLSDLHNVLEDLGCSIDSLGVKLEDVCTPACPRLEPEADKKPEELRSFCRLENVIRDAVSIVCELNDKVRERQDRLQV